MTSLAPGIFPGMVSFPLSSLKSNWTAVGYSLDMRATLRYHSGLVIVVRRCHRVGQLMVTPFSILHSTFWYYESREQASVDSILSYLGTKSTVVKRTVLFLSFQTRSLYVTLAVLKLYMSVTSKFRLICGKIWESLFNIWDINVFISSKYPKPIEKSS